MHAKPSVPVYPAMHLQSVTIVLLDSAKVFAGHDMHVDAPDVLLYLLIPHSMHAALLVAPYVTEYVVMGQGVHVAAPPPE